LGDKFNPGHMRLNIPESKNQIKRSGFLFTGNQLIVNIVDKIRTPVLQIQTKLASLYKFRPEEDYYFGSSS